MIELTRKDLRMLLRAATNNIKDFVTDNDGFIDDWIAENNKSKIVICPKCEGIDEYSEKDNMYKCAFTDCRYEWSNEC
jgi:hypothetical protein